MKSVFIEASILLMIATISMACFITNCPPGGKRSLYTKDNLKQCSKCGPNGSGQCFGPEICCGIDFGCFIKTRESQSCKLEKLNPQQCQLTGKRCEVVENGICSSTGICCSSDHCSLDENCEDIMGNHISPIKDPTSDWLRFIMKSGDQNNRPFGFQVTSE